MYTPFTSFLFIFLIIISIGFKSNNILSHYINSITLSWRSTNNSVTWFLKFSNIQKNLYKLFIYLFFSLVYRDNIWFSIKKTWNFFYWVLLIFYFLIHFRYRSKVLHILEFCLSWYIPICTTYYCIKLIFFNIILFR